MDSGEHRDATVRAGRLSGFHQGQRQGVTRRSGGPLEHRAFNRKHSRRAEKVPAFSGSNKLQMSPTARQSAS